MAKRGGSDLPSGIQPVRVGGVNDHRSAGKGQSVREEMHWEGEGRVGGSRLRDR